MQQQFLNIEILFLKKRNRLRDNNKKLHFVEKPKTVTFAYDLSVKKV